MSICTNVNTNFPTQNLLWPGFDLRADSNLFLVRVIFHCVGGNIGSPENFHCGGKMILDCPCALRTKFNYDVILYSKCHKTMEDQTHNMGFVENGFVTRSRNRTPRCVCATKWVIIGVAITALVVGVALLWIFIEIKQNRQELESQHAWVDVIKKIFE